MWYALRKGKDFKIVCCGGNIGETYPGWEVIAGPCKEQYTVYTPIVSILYKEYVHVNPEVSEICISAHAEK